MAVVEMNSMPLTWHNLDRKECCTAQSMDAGAQKVIQHIITVHCGEKKPQQPLLFSMMDRIASFVGRTCFGTLNAALPMALCMGYDFYKSNQYPSEIAMQEAALVSSATGMFAALMTDTVADAGLRGFQFGSVATAISVVGEVKEGFILNKAKTGFEDAVNSGEFFAAGGIQFSKNMYESWVHNPYCKLAGYGPSVLACSAKETPVVMDEASQISRDSIDKFTNVFQSDEIELVFM